VRNELVMAFDFGLTRIGVAIGQPLTGTATPLAIIKARDGQPKWNQIEALIQEWQPARLVVGLPLNMDGSPSDMSDRAQKFGRRLTGRFNLPVELADERLTTREARSLTGSETIDDVAAQLILESYFRGA
jgi:putative holliday junction resolvase